MGKNEKMQNQPQAQPVLTPGDQIWNEIKDLDILMFSLPNQKVSDYCEPVPVDPSRCFLKVRATSVLPSLEAAIGVNFTCEMAEKYVIISRKKNGF